MENMQIYMMGKAVPAEAKKPIQGGRLNGKTDINPVWRISKLTEIFGPCGIGWKYTITRREMVAGANGEISCFVDVDLFYRWDGQWSEAVPGTGGATFVAKERDGLYTNDECYKMALTDALSVSCKALGIGADVYWEAGKSKYSGKPSLPQTDKPETLTCERCGARIKALKLPDGTVMLPDAVAARSKETYGCTLCVGCMNAAKAEKESEDTAC